MPKEKVKAEVALTKMAVFKGGQICKVIHNNEWWFSVVDVAAF